MTHVFWVTQGSDSMIIMGVQVCRAFQYLVGSDMGVLWVPVCCEQSSVSLDVEFQGESSVVS